MHLLCNFENVYMKSVNIYTNMMANDKKQLIFTYGNGIIVS